MTAITLPRQRLRENPLFAELDSEQLDWLCQRAVAQQLSAGEYLIKENQPGLGFFVLIEGEIAVLKTMRGADMVIGRHHSGDFFGEIQLLADTLTPVALRAAEPCLLARWNEADFRQLLSFCRKVEIKIFRKLSERLQGLSNFVRQQEKMISLGSLAAGLAHELNNPAASLARTLAQLHPRILELQDMNLRYGRVEKSPGQTEQWQALRQRGFNTILERRIKASELARLEDELLDWLEQLAVPRAYDMAPALAEAGVSRADIEPLLAPWRDEPGEMRYQGIQWLAMSFEVQLMVRDGDDAASRISELVKSVKSYAYMDQAPQLEVDIHEGLESTLLMLKHQWKYGVEVVREYCESLPRLPAFASELNQVWTNLLSNAIEAMEGKGRLTLRTLREGGHVVVQIEDTGPGINAELRNRIFEPFFTTKPVGKGTGLGLDIAYRIVTNRHNGYLRFDSQPGRTCFEVGLPIASRVPVSDEEDSSTAA
ncbi:MAG: ATP-binding protein [Wenzhouxiangellaceae bacterium]